LQNIVIDEEIERRFKYVMTDEVRARFSKSENIEFDIEAEYKNVMKEGLRPKIALERSIAQHSKMCTENSSNSMEARALANLLSGDISYRLRLYSYCICKSTDNYLKWLQEDYERKLSFSFSKRD